MSGKARRPCLICGKGLAIHRGKRRVCSDLCSMELKRASKGAGRATTATGAPYGVQAAAGNSGPSIRACTGKKDA